MAEIKDSKIIYDSFDWMAPLHPSFEASSSTIPLIAGSKTALTFMQGMEPFRNYGNASPPYNTTNVTNASLITSSALRQIIVAAEGSTIYAYGINSGVGLFQMSSSSGAVTNAGVWPYTITAVSGTVKGQSVIQYDAKVAGTRASRLFFSFNNSGATAGNPLWNVGMYQLDGATFDPDFMTTAPATPLVSTAAGGGSDAFPIPMIVGDDDILYIGNGNKVHAYDGANAADNEGKFFDSALVLPATFRITSFAKYQQRLVIIGYFDPSTQTGNATVYGTQSRAYFWDYLSLDPYDSISLGDNYADSAFQIQGTFGFFTQGRTPIINSNSEDMISKLKLFNGSTIDTVAYFGAEIPNNGAVEVINDCVYWHSPSFLYMWGSPFGQEELGLRCLVDDNSDEKGAFKQVTSSLILLAADTAALYTLGGAGAGQFRTATASPNFPSGKVGKVRSIKVEFARQSTGNSQFSLTLVSDMQNNAASNTTTVISLLSTITETNISKEYFFDSDGGELSKFRSLAVYCSWDGSASSNTVYPILKRVEITFDTINIDGT